MSKKIEFSKEQTDFIISEYNKGKSCLELSKLFNVSKLPINNLLKKIGILRKGRSNGKKIILTNQQKDKINELYIEKFKNKEEISKLMGLTVFYIEKYLNQCGYRRNKSEGTSIGMVKRFSNIPYDEFLLKMNEFKKYKRKVISVTKKQPISTLKNYNKRGVAGKLGAYHLDHKFSIVEGFKQKICPTIIGNIKNLEFIPWQLNQRKRTNCSIIKEELFKN